MIRCEFDGCGFGYVVKKKLEGIFSIKFLFSCTVGLLTLNLVNAHAVIDQSNAQVTNCYLIISSDGQVSYRCDVVTVTATRDPQPSGPPPTFTPVAGLPGGRGLTLNGKPQDRCYQNASSQAYYRCSGRSGVPPAYATMLNIDPREYVTQGLWRPAVLDFMNIVYKSDDLTVWRGWDSALYSSMQRCSGDTSCMAEVWRYFGQTNIAIPNLGPFGDINWLANVLSIQIQKPTFETSPASKLLTPKVNGMVCAALREAAVKDGCDPIQ